MRELRTTADPKQSGTIILVHNNPSWQPSSRSITDHHSYAMIERDYIAVGSSLSANAHAASALHPENSTIRLK
jgi:hypothetical protein